MNSLFNISYGLFTLAFISALLTHIVATFLFFTVAVLILSVAVYVKDKQDNG